MFNSEGDLVGSCLCQDPGTSLLLFVDPRKARCWFKDLRISIIVFTFSDSPGTFQNQKQDMVRRTHTQQTPLFRGGWVCLSLPAYGLNTSLHLYSGVAGSACLFLLTDWTHPCKGHMPHGHPPFFFYFDIHIPYLKICTIWSVNWVDQKENPNKQKEDFRVRSHLGWWTVNSSLGISFVLCIYFFSILCKVLSAGLNSCCTYELKLQDGGIWLLIGWPLTW